MDVGGQRDALATLTPEITRYPLYRGLGGPRAGLAATGILSSDNSAQASRYTIPAHRDKIFPRNTDINQQD